MGLSPRRWLIPQTRSQELSNPIHPIKGSMPNHPLKESTPSLY